MARVFCSYSHGDERMRQQLGNHFSVLERQNAITLWSDRVIRAGEPFDDEISAQLEAADIILLLISSDFLASSYCNDVEVKRAMERHEEGTTHVVPVILRDCDWRNEPFGKLVATPRDGRPIKSWPDRDRAYKDVVDHIRALLDVAPMPTRPVRKEGGVIPKGSATPRTAPSLDRLKLKIADAVDLDDGADFRPDRLRAQISHLIGVVDDARRFESDKEAANAGHKINYVFDENVFELFVDPARLADYVAIFHRPIWNPRHERLSAWDALNAQSALLTGEYLFSGSLPGQSQQLVYVTDWHREELLRRSSGLMQQLSRQPGRNDVARDYLFRMASLRIAMGAGRAAGIKTAGDNGIDEILNDVEALGEAGVAQEELATYLSSRVAVAALASDRNVAPLFQLQRLFEPAFFERVLPFGSLYNPGEIDDARISVEADLWAQRLLAERDRRSRSNVERGHSSLWSDAQALALIIEVSRTKGKAVERTVFVTGDSLLFSAYRRWHLDQDSQEPFLVRRVAQYAPIFTLGDPDVLQAPHTAFIADMLDWGLVPFNLHERGKHNTQLGVPRRHFAQQIDDLGRQGQSPQNPWDAFFPDLESPDFQKFAQALSWLGREWRQIERIVLGLNPDLLGYRILASLPESVALSEKASTISDREIEQWLSATLTWLRTETFKLWHPIALHLIESVQLASRPDRTPGGPDPHLFGFAGPVGHQTVSLILDQSLFIGGERGRAGRLSRNCARKQEQALLLQPEISFGIAALMATTADRWPEARRFSDLCVRAAQDALPGDVNRNESRYVAAYVALAHLHRSSPRQLEDPDEHWWRGLSDATQWMQEDFEQPAGDRKRLIRLRAGLTMAHLATSLLVLAATGNDERKRDLLQQGLDWNRLVLLAKAGYLKTIADWRSAAQDEDPIGRFAVELYVEAVGGIALLCAILKLAPPEPGCVSWRDVQAALAHSTDFSRLIRIMDLEFKSRLNIMAYLVFCMGRDDLDAELRASLRREAARTDGWFASGLAKWLLKTRDDPDQGEATSRHGDDPRE